MILTIKEYDKIQIRQHRDLANKQISKNDASYLQSIVIENTPVFKLGNRCLVAQQWVGIIALPDFSIEILPKLSAVVSPDNCREILTRMLLVSHQPLATKKLPAAVAFRKNSLVEVLISTFLSSLEYYIKNGLLNSYVKIHSNLDVVKGRILFSKQFNQNILSPTRFHCIYSKYVHDNPLNQFFLCCLHEMQRVSKDSDNKARIRSAMMCFENVRPTSVPVAISQNITFNSTNKTAYEAYMYGKLFLENHSVTISAGHTQMSMMLFDMNRLFETFICQCLRHAYGNKVLYQSSKNYLVIDPATQRKYVKLRPDIILKISSSESIVIDTKWKLPQKFAKESDMHQMNAYSTSIPNISKVYLLFPETANTQQFSGDFDFLSFDGHVRELGIRAVDMSRCLNWNDFLLHLKSLFQ